MEKWDLVDKIHVMLLKIKELDNLSDKERDVVLPDYVNRALQNREKEMSID